MKSKVFVLTLILLAIVTLVVAVAYYPYVFSRSVEGEVVDVQRVTAPTTIVATDAGQNRLPPSQLYSFAVAIRDSSGEIVTASTEDRQWAVVQKGQCAKAKFFPYPPWHLEKSGTYFGARLIHLKDCPPKSN
jgi:hypothetical protein